MGKIEIATIHIFQITTKINNVPLCIPDIFAILILEIKCCFRP